MEIILKNDWDVPIRFPVIEQEKQGYFVGREKEISQLINELKRKKYGSILITGYRGVGKTSLAYKALSEIKDNKTIVVLLNASQLEAESSVTEIKPKKIIQNLIRRLYSTTCDINLDQSIKDQINDLYRKSAASDYKLSEIYQEQHQLSNEFIKERNFDLYFNEKNLPNLIFIISWTIAVALAFGNVIAWEWLNKLIPLLLAFPIPYFFNLSYKNYLKKRIYEESNIKAEVLYKFDASIGNLEFDLEKIHKECAKEKIKLIYVIDELDKLKSDQVIKVLKFFKNLFTLSNAIFIFIGGEELYDLGKEQNSKRDNIYRPKEYTYFTSKYYLSRPLLHELNCFMDDIVETEEFREDKVENIEKFEIFKRALYFEAKNDFFDLISYIKDRIIDFKKNLNPIIEVGDIEEDLQKCRFHKAITILFEEKYMSLRYTNWHKNEILFRTLHEHANTIFSSYSMNTFRDPEGPSIEDELIRIFNRLLERLGAFKITKEDQKNIKGLNTQIRQYQYFGNIPRDPPDHLDTKTEFELRFINIYEKYAKFIHALINVKRKIEGKNEIIEIEFFKDPIKFVTELNEWGFNFANTLSPYLLIYQKLKNEKPPYEYKLEFIESNSNKIENQNLTFGKNFRNTLTQCITRLYKEMNLQSSSLRGNVNLFKEPVEQIREAFFNINHNVIFNQKLTRQILIVENQVKNLKKFKNVIENNFQTHRIISIVDTKTRATNINGHYIISIEAPEKLEGSTTNFFKDMATFLSK